MARAALAGVGSIGHGSILSPRTIAGMGRGLARFDDVGRGDAAPEWVLLGTVRAWDLPRDTTMSLIVLSENVTFRVEVDGEPRMVVRLARPDYGGGAQHIRSELEWIDALRDVGIPTPAPLRGADGDLVQRIRDEGDEVWLASAFEFVAGEALEDRPDFAAHGRGIGELTARLHAQARDWRRPKRFTRFEWDLDDMVGATARWGDWREARLSDRERDLLEEAERRAKRVLAESGETRTLDRWGLIHADLRPSNAILRPDGELVVIDFDDCGEGWYRYDFAAALTFYEHRDEALELAAGWVEGYRETSPLYWADLDEACGWSMIRRLTMLGWQQTHRPDALPAELWAEYAPGTLDVAARYIDDPRALVR
jgi:Ser/Thr protein kinase RdoA (MazF antagonist)